MRRYLPVIICILIFTLPTAPILADDLGQYGHTYPIQETNLLTFIKTRLNSLKQSGQLSMMQQAFIRRVKRHVLRPTPVAGLIHTSSPRTFYYDPTFVLTRDIKDTNGHILQYRGTRINPLDVVPFREVLLFFDGDDPKEIAWVKAVFKRYQGSILVKPIAVSGNIQSMSNELATHVYFDQYGFLVKKFGIQQVPAMMTEDQGNGAKKLKIEEIKLPHDQGVVGGGNA